MPRRSDTNAAGTCGGCTLFLGKRSPSPTAFGCLRCTPKLRRSGGKALANQLVLNTDLSCPPAGIISLLFVYILIIEPALLAERFEQVRNPALRVPSTGEPPAACIGSPPFLFPPVPTKRPSIYSPLPVCFALWAHCARRAAASEGWQPGCAVALRAGKIR